MRKGRKIFFFLLVASIISCHFGFGQSLGNDINTLLKARQSKEALKFEEAIEAYTAHLSLNPADYDAYIERATCSEKLNRYEEAINDYKAAIGLRPGEIDLYRKALIDYLQIENYNKATEMFSTMVDIKNKTVNAYQKMALNKIKAGDFEGAVKEINTALDYDNTLDYSHFIKGVAMDSLGNYQLAIQSYLKAISAMYVSKDYKDAKDKNFYKPYFINLAITQRRLGHFDESIKNLNTALNYDASDPEILCQRGISYLYKGDHLNAMSDFNKSLQINEKNATAYYHRGLLNVKLGSIPGAIGDFTNAILFKDQNPEAHYERGKCYLMMNQFTEAIEEFKLAGKQHFPEKTIKESIESAKKAEYEFNKENNQPDVQLANSAKDSSHLVVKIPINKVDGLIRGKVNDQSGIKSIMIDGVPASFTQEEKNPNFSAQIPLENKEKITIEVTDIYFNTSTQTYEIERTEDKPPELAISSPFISIDQEYFPENINMQSLYVEGRVEDQSLIQKILINGMDAHFSRELVNPGFSVTLDIKGKDSLVIEAEDIYENRTRKSFFINWKSAEEAEKNPMGRTWVVFIENSNYQSLQPLEGTKKDILLMKQALANYSIQKIIHKTNLNKSDMDRFFSIELRDQINKGQVQSLVVWFAGHGKYINESGYWLPVDASKTDEYTYFPITSLKGYLSLYKLRHTLVISDACETGPAFYLAMRGSPKVVNCLDWESTRLKSAQVFTSSDREKSADNSIFAKTFANILNNNPEKCIPIDRISERVTLAVEQNQKQKPKFGNISGLEDESGTFFFMRK
jgi:tetratricopeptide (TPR) repeat protein